MIVGNFITLRALRKNDAQKILDWINSPKLKYYTGTVFPISEIEHQLWFENKLKDKINKIFAIEDNTTNSIIGIIGLKNTDLISRNTELYIYIGSENHWGKGLGTDALKTLIRFSFEELNMHRISLVVFSYNERAISAYEKIGFITEGILRESHYREGKYHDKIMMSLIKNDNKSVS